MPARLAELLTARVSDCGPQAWTLLAAMSVAGRALTEDQLAELTGLDADALHAGLRELESRSLAETAASGRHRARHALLAEAAAARLLPGERRVLHERVAGILQAGGEATAAEAADHWAAAGRAPEELRDTWLAHAGRADIDLLRGTRQPPSAGRTVPDTPGGGTRRRGWRPARTRPARCGRRPGRPPGTRRCWPRSASWPCGPGSRWTREPPCLPEGVRAGATG